MGENMVSRVKRLEQRHRRRHATAKSRRRVAAFERADAALQCFTIRIIVARVHKSARVRAFDVPLVSSGKINRRRNGPGCRIDGAPGVNG